MELFKVRGLLLLLAVFIQATASLLAAPLLSQSGQILFLIRQGEHAKGLEVYRQLVKSDGEHHFDLLHQIGLGILDEGFRQSDPEIQLLSLFGASIALHEEAYYILEEGLKSAYPQIQLVALNALARLHYDQADQAINRALLSKHLLVRLQAAYQLCLKRHPQAITQTESLMYKTPKEILPLYPSFYAALGCERATRLLRRLLNNPSEQVRTAVILSAAEYGRDDLLPQIRQHISHHNYIQQEACAYALGILKDEKSIAKLQSLSCSQYPHVALAAQQALYQLGNKDCISRIQEAAKKENLFAIALLGEIPEGAMTLTELLHHRNIQVRINATLALLEQSNLVCFPFLPEILIQNRQNLAFTEIFSPGRALSCQKAVHSASEAFKEDLTAYMAHLKFKEEILEKAKELSEDAFIKLADAIFTANQMDLIPILVRLLEDLGSHKAIELLQKHQQKVGAPLIRNYCNLALYRLGEIGPYGELLRQWVKSQYDRTLIQFRPFDPWELRTNDAQLTPEDTSRLLIEAFEAFASKQDEPGILILIEAIQHGNSKNRYALAGLLIRATQ